MHFPTHPAGPAHSRLVSHQTPPDTPPIPDPRFGSLLQQGYDKVCPGSLCEECAWILIKCKVTGLGHCTRHSIHHSRSSDRLQILISQKYPRQLMVSGLYENVFVASAMSSGIPPRGLRRWTASDNGSWSHARWLSTSIEKTPGIFSLIRRCTSRHCGRDRSFVGRGISSYGILSRF